MNTAISPDLPLRERKKLRTRQALIDTALDRFTAQGFEGTTLDGLCAEVEISKRTFFRYFDSKEDVAMAPTQDLWAAFLEDLETREPAGTLIGLLGDTLVGALHRMPAPDWAGRALLSRRLAARTPSMNAHGLQFCDRTSSAALDVLRRRFGLDVTRDPRPRLALDLLVASFHYALQGWTAAPGPADRDALAARLREALASLPGTLTLTVRPRHDRAQPADPPTAPPPRA
ncbi:TetR/AcrR family transcriptional regulator [Actinomadura roseirufa]|uniref:TetR/AcrR family transcriptional regulator n=1 Tax=Actinomadura roseirufa TaxID=2094049 RepID=UPI0010413DBC|nr:TetR/AcrR family transcriptional regulator [Actinomadura roseirufa]